MNRIFAVANKKGGVGKTTTTMSLGAALARSGKRILMVDADPQGDLSRYLGYDGSGKTLSDLMLAVAAGSLTDVENCVQRSEREGLDYIPANIVLADTETKLVSVMSRETLLRRVFSNVLFFNYDYILIDCPPSLGMLTINAFAAADKVLVPVELELFAYEAVSSLVSVLNLVRQTVNPSLQLGGIIKTKYDRTIMSNSVSDALDADYNTLVFTTVISKAKEAAYSSYSRRSLVSYNNKLGQQYKQLADELLAREVDT